MTGNAKQVFLVSGQTAQPQVGGGELWSPTIEQHVIVAASERAVYALLSEKLPKFRPVGLATLDDYERAVSKIKDTLNGVETGWGLIHASNLSA